MVLWLIQRCFIPVLLSFISSTLDWVKFKMLRTSVTTKASRATPSLKRSVAMAAMQQKPKREGDISDAFASMAGVEIEPLPDRYRQLKLDLVRGRESAVKNSWRSLLRELRRENELIAAKGPSIVPEVEFKDLEKGLKEKKNEINLRGVVVVKGVIPEAEARAYKYEIEEYVRNNPTTRGEYYGIYLKGFC